MLRTRMAKELTILGSNVCATDDLSPWAAPSKEANRSHKTVRFSFDFKILSRQNSLFHSLGYSRRILQRNSEFDVQRTSPHVKTLMISRPENEARQNGLPASPSVRRSWLKSARQTNGAQYTTVRRCFTVPAHSSGSGAQAEEALHAYRMRHSP